MEAKKERSLVENFKCLYAEFIQYAQRHNLINIVDGNPIKLDFGLPIQMHPNWVESLSSLPSYDVLITQVALNKGIDKNEVQKSIFGLFGNIFSDMSTHFTTINITKSCKIEQHSIENFDCNENHLSDAILHGTNLESILKRQNQYVLIFDNLDIESDIIISDDLKIIKLSPGEVGDKLHQKYDDTSKWEKVKGVVEVSEEMLKTENFEPIISTLLRLYKSGDIRYKATYQKANHLFFGEVYVPNKHLLTEQLRTENDYYENAPSIHNDRWKAYYISDSDALDFSAFMLKNIPIMRPMGQSCRVYNMVSSSHLHLKIPLLFFVVESFFSDVNAEVSFRIALYVTNLMKRDTKFNSLLKKLYGIRSKVAHGDLVSARKEMKKLENQKLIACGDFRGVTELLDEILKDLWKVLLEKNWDPSNSGELIADSLFIVLHPPST
ncbi:MAG: hypothetical protein GY928_37230 [Colwellia sp.]|nr:hypothetical protein [Colwellia sp.]